MNIASVSTLDRKSMSSHDKHGAGRRAEHSVPQTIAEAYDILRSARKTLLRGMTYKAPALDQWRSGRRWPETAQVLSQMAINVRAAAARLEGIARRLDSLADTYDKVDRGRRVHSVNPKLKQRFPKEASASQPGARSAGTQRGPVKQRGEAG